MIDYNYGNVIMLGFYYIAVIDQVIYKNIL